MEGDSAPHPFARPGRTALAAAPFRAGHVAHVLPTPAIVHLIVKCFFALVTGQFNRYLHCTVVSTTLIKPFYTDSHFLSVKFNLE